MATPKDQKLKSRPKFVQGQSKPAYEGASRNEGTAKEAAGAVKRRRKKKLRAPANSDVTAMLIAERGERDEELADQIARLLEPITNDTKS